MKGAELRQKADEVEKQTGVALQLKDGTRLISDIYTQAGSPPAPALLMRQPYGRSIASTVVYAQPEFFAREGFVVVIQDVRGRGDSDGVFNAFTTKPKTASKRSIGSPDLMNAMAGSACMGFSYQAYTQLARFEKPPGSTCRDCPTHVGG